MKMTPQNGDAKAEMRRYYDPDSRDCELMLNVPSEIVESGGRRCQTLGNNAHRDRVRTHDGVRTVNFDVF